MSLKILLDCVVTAGNPASCSTNIQYITFVNRVLAHRQDVFFYWLIPDYISEETEKAAYPQHPHIRYKRVPQHRDRTKEYLTLSKELDTSLAFNGDMWDFDIVLTMRTGLMPMFKMLAIAPRSYKMTWLKQFWLIEAMVLMDFKPTVMTFDPDTKDRFTLCGYLAADTVWLTSQVDKPEITRRARELFPPSTVMELEKKITPVGYGNYQDPISKDPADFPDPENGKPLCIAHAGRMEHANKIVEINKLMVSNFAMLGDKVELLVTTVSDALKVFDTDVVNMRQASRDEFWELAKTKMHVLINLAEESGSALSVLEPMMLGVPAIIGPRRKTEQTLGADYPFIVDNITQAYAMVRMLYEDYPTMYAKWVEWQQGAFKKILHYRMIDQGIYNLMDRRVSEFDEVRARFTKEKEGKADNKFVKDVLAHVEGRDEFVLYDVVKEMVEQKKVGSVILKKMTPSYRDSLGLIWVPDWNVIRNILLCFYGWEDASPALGHFRRVK